MAILGNGSGTVTNLCLAYNKSLWLTGSLGNVSEAERTNQES